MYTDWINVNFEFCPQLCLEWLSPELAPTQLQKMQPLVGCWGQLSPISRPPKKPAWQLSQPSCATETSTARNAAVRTQHFVLLSRP